MRRPGDVLLVSCYELGHQPVALASPLGFLRDAGYPARALDIAVEPFDEDSVARARFVGISVPMHTALRLGLLVAGRVRKVNPSAHVCFYGLYASLNASTLFSRGADSVIGGEFEQPLLDLVGALEKHAEPSVPGVATPGDPRPPHLEKLTFRPPDRSALPPLERYSRLERDDRRLVSAAVETTRGCRHMCRHCPIPPVYEGRLFVVPCEIVIGDVERLVEAGARHITFADADFLNGPGHTLPIVREMHERFGGMTFDITTKVEHILEHRGLFPELASLGCLFVVSAVESLSDEVLRRLDKGHTRADVHEALGVVQGAGITFRPSLLPFTPWSTLEDYRELLGFIARHDLIEQVDPVQLSIRLLVPPGSLVLSEPTFSRFAGPLDEEAFTVTWTHPDPRMDSLQKEIARIVAEAADRGQPAPDTFERILGAAGMDADPPARRPGHRPRPPRLTEPWFC